MVPGQHPEELSWCKAVSGQQEELPVRISARKMAPSPGLPHARQPNRASKEKKHTLTVSLGKFKVQVLSLERIIASKKATGRQKDKLALPVLSDALLAIKCSKTTHN